MIKLVNFLTQPIEKQLETLEWRNSSDVSRWFQIKHIDLETHKKWLASLHNPNPHNIAFFIEYKKKFIGVTYFHSIDYIAKNTDWGIYIFDSTLRGHGIGTETLKKSLEYANNKMIMKKVFLEVLPDNYVAQKVYENVGFQFIEQKTDGTKRYQYTFTKG